MFIVYKIVNDFNSNVYIGITTKTLAERWSGHLQRYRSGDTRHLYSAMRLYGIEHFYIVELDSTATSYEELLEKEKYYVNLYNAYKDGYNMTCGGDINPMDCEIAKNKHDNKMRDDVVRKKISQSLKEFREKHPFTDEHRKKLSSAAMGNHNCTHPDNRSIPCYCVLESGERFDFPNYRVAGKWWFDTLHPFGVVYSEATYQRKIKLSILGKDIVYITPHAPRQTIVITNIRWFKKEGDVK